MKKLIVLVLIIAVFLIALTVYISHRAIPIVPVTPARFEEKQSQEKIDVKQYPCDWVNCKP